MYDFSYHRPKTVAEAASLLSTSEDATLIAGGHTLIPTLKQRLASPSDLVDLSGIDELRQISAEGDVLSIGAGATHRAVSESAEVKRAIPALAEMASDIGDAHVRARGTIGGSVANNDPAADYPAACLALGATIHTNVGSYAADEFFVGMFETALEEGDIITKVTFPVPKRANYQKFRNPASRYALVGVFVAETNDGVRVAVTGAAPSVFRAREIEQALDGNFSAEALKGITLSAEQMSGDIHASPEYRAHLVTVMARRAVEACG